MKDFDRLIVRFRQFGGMRLLWQYAHMGVLWLGIKECVKCAIHGRSFKSIYPIITKKIDHCLVEKYKDIENCVPLADKHYDSEQHKDTIWFCWLQGMNNAPQLVHACYDSLLRNLPTNKVIIITEQNYNEYISMPDYIEQKYRKGIIPAPLFSDILRLYLLIYHGGTWIDASVLCTSDKYWDVIQKSDLFLFRYFRNGKAEGISNWFIHSKPGNPLLQDILRMLLAYWRDFNCTVEYYIFHLFFSVAARRHSEIMKLMPRGNSYANIRMGSYLSKNYSQDLWEKLTAEVSFHKLNYRNGERASKHTHSFYNRIINLYSPTNG